MLLRKLIIRIFLQVAFFAVLLFAPAGTLHWWQAWVLLGLLFIASVVTVAALYPNHKAILEERMKPPLQKGQPFTDKVLVLLLLAAWFGALVFIPLDVFHFHLLLGKVPFAGAVVGLGLIGTGCWISYRVLIMNDFAALAVRSLHERNQRVIDADVYAVVRHPMYAGASLLSLGLPLWLGSVAGCLAALAPILMFAVRCVFEERFLRRELDGYEDYMRRVRYRLVPGVW